ncbi:MAG: DUF1153 domain-containing protein [Stellaceae bacterium]
MSGQPISKFAASVDPLSSVVEDLTVADVADLDLPSPNTRRWVIRRKAAVVEAVERGVLTLEEACRRYRLSAEEFETWRRLVQTYGVPGLRVTRLHTYRGLSGQD